MVYNLTDLANEAVQVGTEASLKLGVQVGTEHILFGLATVKESKASKLLATYGVTDANLSKILASNSSSSSGIGVDYTPRTKEMFVIANNVAKKTNQRYISTEHLLVALLSQTDSYAIKILAGIYKLNVFEMRQKLIAFLTGAGPKVMPKPNFDGFEQVGNVKTRQVDSTSNYDEPFAKREETSQSRLPETLLEMGSDVTLRAKNGKIDPIIGREEEIERVIEILCRKTKNNPVLIGEAGVGKSAIIEGLALKIVHNDVPQLLKNKIIYSLDIGGLMAGTKYRGAMEEKLKTAIETIISNQNIIVFIDEIHTLAQAGSEKGETSPADMLKPYLARGEMQTIGATTTNEYRKFIEQDKALERRFQPIMVEPPTVEQTIEILRGLKDSYEAFHKVRIEDEALVAAASLSNKYIMDRSLPDKAIDLVDEASARAKVKSNYLSADEVKYTDQIATLEANKEDAVMQEDFEKASKLRDEIASTKKLLEVAKQKAKPADREKVASITAHEIAEVVSKWTNIPVTKLTEGETEKLLKLEEILTNRVKGQSQAVSVVAKAIRRSRIGMGDGKRPVGSFLFLGSTGVGKTELCKALAQALFDDENKMIRLDMSEFMESHSVSKLIGSPPGYVGFDDGGQLTEQVRRKPYSVILLDEIEKAHPDVFNMLLQILDDGRLTDSHGRTVNFKNCIIVMTSNIGSDVFSKKSIGLGFNDGTVNTDLQKIAIDELKKRFKPELINRIDNIVVFNKLPEDVLTEIAKNMLKEIKSNLSSQGIDFKITDNALKFLVKNGTNDEFGARPLRRIIMSKIEDELAEQIISKQIKHGDNVLVDSDGINLQFIINK